MQKMHTVHTRPKKYCKQKNLWAHCWVQKRCLSYVNVLRQKLPISTFCEKNGIVLRIYSRMDPEWSTEQLQCSMQQLLYQSSSSTRGAATYSSSSSGQSLRAIRGSRGLVFLHGLAFSSCSATWRTQCTQRTVERMAMGIWQMHYICWMEPTSSIIHQTVPIGIGQWWGFENVQQAMGNGFLQPGTASNWWLPMGAQLFVKRCMYTASQGQGQQAIGNGSSLTSSSSSSPPSSSEQKKGCGQVLQCSIKKFSPSLDNNFFYALALPTITITITITIIPISLPGQLFVLRLKQVWTISSFTMLKQINIFSSKNIFFHPSALLYHNQNLCVSNDEDHHHYVLTLI